MKDNRELAWKWIYSAEHGITVDTGGYTNDGFSQKYNPDLDVKNMTMEDKKREAFKRYWDTIQADELPSGIDIVLFDCSFNQGVGYASHLIKKYITHNTGNLTTYLLSEVLFHRLMRYIIESQDGGPKDKHRKYLDGWMYRILHLVVFLKKEMGIDLGVE